MVYKLPSMDENWRQGNLRHSSVCIIQTPTHLLLHQVLGLDFTATYSSGIRGRLRGTKLWKRDTHPAGFGISGATECDERVLEQVLQALGCCQQAEWRVWSQGQP